MSGVTMSISLMNDVFHTKIGSQTLKLIILKLADNANDNGECFPSYQHIAEQCEVSKRTVIRAINTLCEKGFLIKKPSYKNEGKEQGSNRYIITLQGSRGDYGRASHETSEVASKYPNGNFVGAKEVLGGSDRVSPGSDTVSPGSDRVSPGGVTQCHPNHKYITINKTYIPPIVPLKGGTDGSIREENLSTNLAAERCLEFYNDKAGCKCRDAKPFVDLLTETKSRKGYTEDEIKLVVEWALTQWKRRDGTPKPVNICRVTRFDGYLADAEKWRNSTATLDPAAVVEAYNNTFGNSLPYAELDRDLERKIYKLTDSMKEKTTEAFVSYFDYFNKHAPDFYFGNNNTGWTADIDFLLKPETLRKTRNFP